MAIAETFQIGRSALAAYQAALAITGQNIANIGNENYTRQSSHFVSLDSGTTYGNLRPGAGVQVDTLRRHFDEAIEARLRSSAGSLASAAAIYQALSQTEASYNELTEEDISTQLSEFFAQFSDLSAAPQSTTSRNLTIANADSIIHSIKRQRESLVQQIEDVNTQITTAATRAGQIASDIATLNERIAGQESDGATIASALRDQRDTLLRELGELMDIEVREQGNGSINVYVGSEPLVEFDRARGPIVEKTLVDGLEVAAVRFDDTHANVILRDGKLHGLLEIRDTYLKDQIDRFDALAGGLIYEVNRIHSTGVGLVGYESLTSEYSVSDVDAALNSTNAGLPFPLENGTFVVHVRDTGTGQTITRQIHVDLDGLNGDDTTLNSLAADLDAVPGLTATVTADNRIQLDAANGQELHFSEDSSGALAALGLAGFFTGQDGTDINVCAAVRSDPRLIAASLSGATNDGDNAGKLASLGSAGATSTAGRACSVTSGHRAHLLPLSGKSVRSHSLPLPADACRPVVWRETADADHSSRASGKRPVATGLVRRPPEPARRRHKSAGSRRSRPPTTPSPAAKRSPRRSQRRPPFARGEPPEAVGPRRQGRHPHAIARRRHESR